MRLYNVHDWYWAVAGDLLQVYASKRGIFVLVADLDYVAFLADGNQPTRIDSIESLAGVLAEANMRPVDATVLDSYQGKQADHAIVKLLMRLIFNLNNRVLTLEGKQPLTVAQARAWIKGQM